MYEDIDIEVERSPGQESSPSRQTLGLRTGGDRRSRCRRLPFAICAVLVTRAELQQADAARELACFQRAQAESIVIGPGSMQIGTEDYKNRVAEC